MACKPECIKTASLDGAGHRIMVSVEGNKKYPAPHTPHKQCEDCEKAEHRELLAEIERLKDKNILGPSLASEWQRLQAKTKVLSK